MARVGVLTIIDEEFECVREALNADAQVSGPYYTTDPASCQVVLRQAADRGNIQAVQPTRDLIESFQPEMVLIVGIAGGIAGRDNIQLGDVVVANYLHYAEFRKATDGADRARFAAYDHPAVSLREELVDPARRAEWQTRIAVQAPENVSPPVVHIGGVVATEKVMGDPDHAEQRRLVATFDDALAVEMESVGVGRAVHEARGEVNYNVRFIVIRGISDLVHSRSPGLAGATGGGDATAAANNNSQRQLWKRYAAASAAAFAAEVVDMMLATTDPRP
jgi:nucleoside phosphorylase